MKRISIFLLLMAVLVVMTAPVSADSSIVFNAKDGTVTVDYDADDYAEYKVLVQKGNDKYAYNLFEEHTVFPLQMGSGKYKVLICQKTVGNKYRVVTSASEQVDVDEMSLYKTSIQNISWDAKSESTKLAQRLSLGKLNELEKFDAVYDYVVEKITYDFLKAEKLRNMVRYLPSNADTLKNQKGICYDYSSLTASMLRSLDIPTKLMEGKSSYTSEYHAWNEVFLDGKWVVVDTTIDAQLVRNNQTAEYSKAVENYVPVKNY